MTLIKTARQAMAFVRNLPRLVTIIWAEFQGLDTRITNLEGGKSQEMFELIELKPDAAASDTWEIPIFKAPAGLTVQDVVVIPASTIGQGSNYMSLDVQNKGSNGSGTTSLGSLDVNSTHQISGMVGTDLVTSDATITSGQVISLKKTVQSAGQAFPGGLVQIKYILT